VHNRPHHERIKSSGEVAKRLCSGLQSRLGRFDSDPRLQIINGRASFEARFVFTNPTEAESNLLAIERTSKVSSAA
jgi:hypothetical protein